MTELIVAFILGVGGSLTASYIFEYSKNQKLKKLEQSAQLTGTWEQTIRDSNGTVLKKDFLLVKQSGLNISATSKREFPEELSHKSWEFHGRFERDLLIGYFYGINGSTSRGTSQLYEVNDKKLKGFYYKTSSNNQIDGNTDAIELVKKYEKVDIEWNKM